MARGAVGSLCAGPMTDDVPPSFDDALALYRAGRLGEARAALNRLLAREPEHEIAWTALGYLERDIGDAAGERMSVAFDVARDPAG